MTFTDSQAWFTVLLVLHVFGAIAGIGPSFAFSIIGPAAGKDPPNALLYTRLLLKIEKAMVIPTAYFLQPVTGALLIFNRSAIRSNFWQEEWLVISIVAYIALLVISVIDNRILHRMVDLMEGGQAGTPEFMAIAKKPQIFGPIMSLLVVLIAILMIWKPLSECAGPLLRC